MSQKEVQRVKVIENAAGGKVSVREASRLLQLSERQVQRLKGRYQPDSLGWVQHGNRGRSTSQANAVLVLRRLQPALRPFCRRSRLPVSFPCPAASISPVASACTTSAWLHRSHRHPKRPYHLPAALAGPAWLCRRNRRTVASAGPHLAQLSRRSPSPRAAPAASRTCRTPPCPHHHGTEKKNPEASHLQSFRPPCFSSRYLNDKGGDRILLQLMRHFLVATTPGDRTH
jgi:hypothetical protein